MWNGAIDDGCAVALLLQFTKGLSNGILIVLFGCEELGGKYPIYWARGSKEFVKRFKINHLQKIVDIECVGTAESFFSDAEKWPQYVRISDVRNFPVKKTKFLNQGVSSVQKFYHTVGDAPYLIKQKWVEQAWRNIWKSITD